MEAMEVMAMEDMEDMDMAMEDMDTVMDMDTAMATLIGTMVTGTTGTVMADGGAATGMATVSVHAGAGHPAVTSGFATSRDLLISGNSGRRLRTVALLFRAVVVSPEAEVTTLISSRSRLYAATSRSISSSA